MPLPSDEKVVALAEVLLKEFDVIFGEHPGFRPTHAKGTLLSGTFRPTQDAASLTRAPHFARESSPVLVRFSDTTGIPTIPDNDPVHACGARAYGHHRALDAGISGEGRGGISGTFTGDCVG